MLRSRTIEALQSHPGAGSSAGEERGAGEDATVVPALRRIQRAVERHSRKLLDEHGLSGPQLGALRELERCGALTPAEIAARLFLSRATVTGVVARLVARGLVVRGPAPGDRRSVRLALAEPGAALLARAPSLLDERFGAALRELQPWERLALLSALERIASMMESPPTPRRPSARRARRSVSDARDSTAPRPDEGA